MVVVHTHLPRSLDEIQTTARLTIADIFVSLDDATGVPLYRQIYEGLRDAIADGRLPPGARLPSTRRLAGYLDVSRTTVLVAFEQLIAEGFLVAAVGSGSRVADHVPPPLPASAVRAAAAAAPARVSRRGMDVVAVPRPARHGGSGSGAFRTGQPPVEVSRSTSGGA